MYITRCLKKELGRIRRGLEPAPFNFIPTMTSILQKKRNVSPLLFSGPRGTCARRVRCSCADAMPVKACAFLLADTQHRHESGQISIPSWSSEPMACIQTSSRLLAVVNKHESGTHQHMKVKVWDAGTYAGDTGRYVPVGTGRWMPSSYRRHTCALRPLRLAIGLGM